MILRRPADIRRSAYTYIFGESQESVQTSEDKQIIFRKINSLPDDEINQAIQIIEKREKNSGETIDFNSLSTLTLNELLAFYEAIVAKKTERLGRYPLYDAPVGMFRMDNMITLYLYVEKELSAKLCLKQHFRPYTEINTDDDYFHITYDELDSEAGKLLIDNIDDFSTTDLTAEDFLILSAIFKKWKSDQTLQRIYVTSNYVPIPVEYLELLASCSVRHVIVEAENSRNQHLSVVDFLRNQSVQKASERIDWIVPKDLENVEIEESDLLAQGAEEIAIESRAKVQNNHVLHAVLKNRLSSRSFCRFYMKTNFKSIPNESEVLGDIPYTNDQNDFRGEQMIICDNRGFHIRLSIDKEKREFGLISIKNDFL